MNQYIIDLKAKKAELDKQYSHLEYERDYIAKKIGKAIYEEDSLYAKIIDKYLLEILGMIRERGLTIKSVEHLTYNSVRIEVDDGVYQIALVISDGIITWSDKMFNSERCSKRLREKMGELIRTKILPFCDEHKKDIEQEEDWDE